MIAQAIPLMIRVKICFIPEYEKTYSMAAAVQKLIQWNHVSVDNKHTVSRDISLLQNPVEDYSCRLAQGQVRKTC